MKDNYRGLLTQEERWKIWEKSLDKKMGSYSIMRDRAEEEKFKKRLKKVYNYDNNHYSKL